MKKKPKAAGKKPGAEQGSGSSGGHLKKLGVGAVAFLAGLVAGTVIMWGIRPADAARVQVVRGYAAGVNEDGTSLNVSEVVGEQGRWYTVTGAKWQDASQPWTDRRPSCIQAGAPGQRVRLGTVRAEKVGDAPTGPIVIWFECLGAGEASTSRP